MCDQSERHDNCRMGELFQSANPTLRTACPEVDSKQSYNCED